MTSETPAPIDPAATALLVVDYQVGIMGRVEDAAAGLLARAREVSDRLRERGATVAYVRVAFADGEVPTGTMGRRIGAEAARTQFSADAPATQLHPDLDVRPQDIVVRKTRVGPFARTDLDEQLRGAGVDTLLIGGVSTSGCVLSAVRDAHDRDFRLIVLSDLCADPDPEVHACLIDRVFPRQADVIESAQLETLLA